MGSGTEAVKRWGGIRRRAHTPLLPQEQKGHSVVWHDHVTPRQTLPPPIMQVASSGRQYHRVQAPRR